MGGVIQMSSVNTYVIHFIKFCFFYDRLISRRQNDVSSHTSPVWTPNFATIASTLLFAHFIFIFTFISCILFADVENTWNVSKRLHR